MSNPITDTRYPLCSRLGVLRRPNRGGRLVVSTAALHDALGWAAYQRYLPVMEYYPRRATNPPAGPTPESAEAFLRTLNGKGTSVTNKGA